MKILFSLVFRKKTRFPSTTAPNCFSINCFISFTSFDFNTLRLRRPDMKNLKLVWLINICKPEKIFGIIEYFSKRFKIIENISAFFEKFSLFRPEGILGPKKKVLYEKDRKSVV